MDIITFKSTESIRERLNILEDQGLASGNDFETWYADEDKEIISYVEIEKLGLRYVNDGTHDELYDEHLRAEFAGTADLVYRLG